jgi:hypothetical protein
MLERGNEHGELQPASPGTVIPAHFARDVAHFAVGGPDRPHHDARPGPVRPSEAILQPGFAAEAAGAAR